MNEALTIILLSILSSFILFSISYILIKKLKINHPKDRSRIFIVLMTSILILFLISISVISMPLQNNEKNYSLLVVMDETQIENNSYQEAENPSSYDVDVDESSYSRYQNILSISINPSEYIENIISKLIKTKTNSTINSLNSKIPKNENLLYSALYNKDVNEKQIREESTIALFLMFNLILLFLCISYLFDYFIIDIKYKWHQ